MILIHSHELGLFCYHGHMVTKQRGLAMELRKRIASGEFSVTNKLPTEDRLMERYGVSRYCVRGAIAELTEAGEVFPVCGSGVFVRERRDGNYLPLGTSYGISADFPGRRVTSEVRELALVRADARLALRMRCDEGDWVWRVVRLRRVDGLPISYETACYLKEFVPYIGEDVAGGSLYSYVRDDLGLRFGFVDKTVYLDRLDASAAGSLGLREGAPSICVEDDAFLSNGRLFNSSRSLYHSSNARFYSAAPMR